MIPLISFAVYGIPAPQGSKKHVGRGIMVESSKKVKPWREAVKWAALEHKHLAIRGEVPIRVVITFTMPKPTSAPKKKTTYPCKSPDLDKLVRSTLDSLTDIGLWDSDARVCLLIASKVYPCENDLALDSPGAWIQIERMA